MALEGIDAKSSKAEDDAREIIKATSNFKDGSIAMQMGTIKVVAVELVRTLASIIARKPKREINIRLFKHVVHKISKYILHSPVRVVCKWRVKFMIMR